MKTARNAHDAIITDADFDRLDQLVSSPRYRPADAQRLFGLKSELDRRVVVAPNRVPKAVVTMNSRVKVRDLATDDVETYTLVYPDAADIEQNRLSVLAPMGTALLGRFIGDRVEFKAPAGVRRMRIEKIVYQPEAAGDFHL
jgi:regulator of nucleoside diphosphate kinase